MTMKNNEKMINELLNNIVVQFIRETHNNIFINNEFFIVFNIITYFSFTIS